MMPDRRTGGDRRRGWSEGGSPPSAWRAGAGQPLIDRRSGDDRRSGADNRLGIDRRAGIDRRIGVGWRHNDLGGKLSPEQALNLVSEFYSASMDARFWPTALAKLCDAINAQACALASYDFAAGTGTIDQAVGIDLELIGVYSEVYARSNVWLQREEMFRFPGVVWTGADLVSESEARSNEHFQRWLAPQGLEQQVFGLLERHSSTAHYLYAARPAAAGPFNADEVTLLRRLLPYLQRSLRSGELLRRSQDVRRVATETLEIMPIGVIQVSLGGAVLAANRIAREVMAAKDVLTIGRSGLEVERDGRRTRFRDLIGDAMKRGHHNQRGLQMAFPVVRPHGRRPLSIAIMPVRLQSQNASWEEPAAVIFIGDPDRKSEIDESRLRQLYGLTNAEARVAALLACGHRLDEIAEMLDVAYETTRKHLKKVLSKAETDRQAELVRMIVTGPGGLLG
jgi:DNA-binding CsgD family transcriptional regulator